MRADEMTVGGTYVMKLGSRRRRVTVLETPPEVKSQARVRVRLEDGIKAGEVIDVPSRRIQEWATRPDRGSRPAEAKQRRLTRLLPDRPVAVGDTVTWPVSGEVLWTVDALEADARHAQISSVLFGGAQTHRVPVTQLRIHVEPATPRPRAAPKSVSASPLTPPDLSPEKPRRLIDELLDDVIFTEECVAAYTRRTRLQELDALSTLRDEIRRRGFVARDTGSAEWGRIRVPGRFDVVLTTRPSFDALARISKLHWVGRSGTQRRGR